MTDESTEQDMTYDDALLNRLLRAAADVAEASTASFSPGQIEAMEHKRQYVLVQASPLLGRLLVSDDNEDATAHEVGRTELPEAIGGLIGGFGSTALHRVRDSGQSAAAREVVRLTDPSLGLNLCVLIERNPDQARVLIVGRDGNLANAVELARLRRSAV